LEQIKLPDTKHTLTGSRSPAPDVASIHLLAKNLYNLKHISTKHATIEYV